MGGPGQGGIAPGVGAVGIGAFAAIHGVAHRAKLLSQRVHRLLAEPPALGLAGMAAQPRGGGGIGQVDDVAVGGREAFVIGDRMEAMPPGGRGARGGEPQQHRADQFFGEAPCDRCALEQAQGVPPGGQANGPASGPAVEQLGVQGCGQGLGGEVGPMICPARWPRSAAL